MITDIFESDTNFLLSKYYSKEHSKNKKVKRTFQIRLTDSNSKQFIKY